MNTAQKWAGECNFCWNSLPDDNVTYVQQMTMTLCTTQYSVSTTRTPSHLSCTPRSRSRLGFLLLRVRSDCCYKVEVECLIHQVSVKDASWCPWEDYQQAVSLHACWLTGWLGSDVCHWMFKKGSAWFKVNKMTLEVGSNLWNSTSCFSYSFCILLTFYCGWQWKVVGHVI